MRSLRIVILLLILANCRLFAQRDPFKKESEHVWSYLKEHNYFKAIELCNAEISAGDKANDQSRSAVFLSLKGMAYLDTIDADSGRLFLEKALSKAYHLKRSPAVYPALHGLGKYYYRNCDYKSSIKFYQTLNYYSRRDSLLDYVLTSNYCLSANYNLLDSPSLSAHYAKIAADAAFRLRDTNSYIKSLLAISNEFFLLNKVDSVDFYLNKARQVFLASSEKQRSVGADINNGLVKASVLKKDYAGGVKYGRMAVSEGLRNNLLPMMNIYYDNLAICFTNLRQYDSAVYYYEKALNIETRYNYVDDYKEDLKELSRIYRLLGKPDKSDFYIARYFSTDSLYRKSNNEMLDSLKTAYEEEKSQLSLASEKQKLQALYNQKQQYFLLIFGILAALACALLYLFYSRYKNRKESEKRDLMIQVKDSEIKALQARINPHFIFNSMNSLLEYTRSSDKEQVLRYMTKFSKLMRMVLDASGKKSVLIIEEMELLKLYTEMENFRFGNNFECTISADPSLDVNNLEIPAMIVQPFVENAILHGLQNKYSLFREESKTFSGKLSVHFQYQDPFVKCTVTDNGIGRERAAEIKNNKMFPHKSIGLRITKDRLDLLSSHACKIEFTDLKDAAREPAGTSVEILIPVSDEF